MTKKRVLLSALILILMMSIVAGCGLGSKKAANELLQEAFIKSSEIKSMAFDGVMKLNLDLSGDVSATLGPEEQMVIDLLKNAEITYRGNTQMEPFQTEVIFSAKIPFEGMQMQFDLPILMNTEKMWLKVPSLPVPGFEGFVGKFIELDFKQLAELSGEPIPNLNDSMQASTKFSNEVLPIFFNNYDETYFSNVDVKTLNLPSGSNAKNAVEFKVTQDQLKSFIITFIEKVVPEMLDVMSKSEYQQLFGLTPDMVAQAKSELTVSSAELDEAMTEMSEVLNNLVVSAVFAIDKDGYMIQQKYTVSGKITSPVDPGTVRFALEMVANSSKINETLTFENSFPPSPVMPLEELMMMGMSYLDPFAYDESYDDFYDEDYYDDYDLDDELALLYEELFVQHWFIVNEDIINELYDTDFEFVMDLEDPAVIRALIDDEGYRAEFFAYYGVELK